MHPTKHFSKTHRQRRLRRQTSIVFHSSQLGKIDGFPSRERSYPDDSCRKSFSLHLFLRAVAVCTSHSTHCHLIRKQDRTTETCYTTTTSSLWRKSAFITCAHPIILTIHCPFLAKTMHCPCLSSPTENITTTAHQCRMRRVSGCHRTVSPGHCRNYNRYPCWPGKEIITDISN